MMNKSIFVIAATALALSLSACGDNKQAADAAKAAADKAAAAAKDAADKAATAAKDAGTAAVQAGASAGEAAKAAGTAAMDAGEEPRWPPLRPLLRPWHLPPTLRRNKLRDCGCEKAGLRAGFFFAVCRDAARSASAKTSERRADPVRDFAVVLDDTAQIAAEAVLVQLFAGLRVPQPAAVGREFVAEHQRAGRIVGRVTELELVVDEVDARAANSGFSTALTLCVSALISAISSAVAQPSTRMWSSLHSGSCSASLLRKNSKIGSGSRVPSAMP